MPQLQIGCSGFNYAHWKNIFYPDGLSQKDWLGYYSGIFSTVELNVTFYRLPEESSLDNWYRRTPRDFVFAVKGSRYITHIKKMKDVEDALERFFARALRLGSKLGVVLWQFPPSYRADAERLKAFLKLLSQYKVRSSFEFRNETWMSPEIFDTCRSHNVALCMADWPEFVSELPLTADFVYIRRHGRAGSYEGCYSSEFLRGDAARLRGYLGKKSDVYIYFNNDARGCAPANARELMALSGIPEHAYSL